MTRAMLAAAISAGLAFSAAAQLREQPGEMVEVVAPRLCPTDNQQRGSRGEIVQVKREDDANGKWNYEVVVRTNGKEWGFEIDPNGKLLRQHTEIKM